MRISCISHTGKLLSAAPSALVALDPERRQPSVSPSRPTSVPTSTADAAAMAEAFDSTARMTFMSDTGLTIIPIAEYIDRVRAAPRRAGPDAVPRRIAMLDVAGNAAVARIEMDFPTGRTVDYMMLLRFPDGWRIVNETFARAPR